MSNWPVNPYLDAWLRTGEGQAYLKKHNCFDAWRQRHLLDPMPPAVRLEEVPGFFLMNPDAEVLISNDAPAPEAGQWEF